MNQQGRSVAKLEEIPPGESRVVTLEGQEVAVFNVEGRLYAVGNRCPHRGGPLSRGHLEGTAIRCPIHGWLFDLESGQCINRPQSSVPAYSVSRENGNLCVKP
ncbi:MAG: nitrite reductase small subunit NirD [Candidatus Omnitrophica bacterium]|nr:nitrite reductase small subunit NirD [Candidatus Omnitrophota bacterium]